MKRFRTLSRRTQVILMSIALPVALAAAAFAYWTLSPLLYDVRVSEALPGGEADAAPMAIAEGEFADADRVHRASGTARLVETADGERLIRFDEDFQVINGPDLFVWLTEDPQGDPDAGYLDLGRLKGNLGSQNYAIPDDVDLSLYEGVIVWCKAFGVPFGRATLQSTDS